MFTITAKTTDYTIEKSTVQELRESLAASNGRNTVDYRGCRKPDLVEAAQKVRDALATQAQAAEELAENQRLVQLEGERKLTSVSAAHQAVMECLNDQMADAQKKVDDFFAKVNKAPGSAAELTYQLGWRVDDLYFAAALQYNLSNLAGFFHGQTVEQTKTTAEVAKILQVELDRHLSKLLDHTLRCDTRPMDVIKQTAEVNAAQRCAKLLKRLIPAYATAVITGNVEKIRHAHWCM